MGGRYKAYSEYQDSGTEWLGAIPVGWCAKRMKRVVFLLADKTSRRSNPVALENIEGWTGRHVASNTEFQGEGVAFDRGDLLFGKLRPYLAKALLAEKSGEAVGDFHVLRPSEGSYPRFIQYQVLTPGFIDIVNGSTYGAKMPRASWEFVGNVTITQPPLPEQKQIAKFLDHETGKIDALIEKQQALIALLQEKRQAVISHAVTKGLNPEARMKDSGVEWLGDVPEHWEKRPLYAVMDFRSGMAHEPFVDPDGSFICVNARFVSTSGFSRKKCSKNLTPASPEDILMVMSDLPNGRALAKAYFVKDEDNNLAVNQRVCALTTKQGEARFLYYFLDRNEGLLSKDDGCNQTHLSNDNYRKLPILFPPLCEQKQIAKKLDQLNVTFERLSEQAEIQINLLQERRTALISAAVTGKIDVRDWDPAPETRGSVK